MIRTLLCLVPLVLLSACDMFPTKESKAIEAEEKWFDRYYGTAKESNDYCNFYGTCRSKTEESGWDWWTGGGSDN